jgi:hypothetical protein
VLQGTKPGLVTISAKNSADIDQLEQKLGENFNPKITGITQLHKSK